MKSWWFPSVHIIFHENIPKLQWYCYIFQDLILCLLLTALLTLLIKLQTELGISRCFCLEILIDVNLQNFCQIWSNMSHLQLDWIKHWICATEIYLVLTSLRCVLNSMMGRNQRQHNIQCPDSVCLATKLNQFYVRSNNNSDEKWTPTGHPVFPLFNNRGKDSGKGFIMC